MIVAIIGANGRTGRQFTAAALAAGVVVRAGVRGPHNLEDHDNLTIVACDALSKNEIDNLIKGSDAVVSLIGHGPGVSATVQKTATQYVLNAMKQQGIKRFISLTSTGVRMPGDKPGLMDRLGNWFMRQSDPDRFRDGVAHAHVMMQSDCDWTLLRVLKLTNGRHKGSPLLAANAPSEIFTPRARVAATILQLLEGNDYIRQAPVVRGVTK